MKVLLTGGAGFIGSHIAEQLLEADYDVVIVDNLITGNLTNVPQGAKLYKVDIREELDLIFLKEQPDYVIHQAAQVSVSSSMEEPLYDGDENILGTINLLQACVTYKVKKFIFASSAALYGAPSYLSIDEKHPLSPVSFYGLSKLNAEAYIQMFSKLYGLAFTILRYANVYGMRQNAKGEAGVVAIFIDQLMNHLTPTIFGDGTQTRDFVFVKDVARANVAALNSLESEILNISTETQISILDIITQLSEILKINVSPNFEPERKGDIRHSYLSNELAKEKFNWTPRYSFAEGLKETVHFYQNKAEITNIS
ncbi:NAD-dependent epimerase/dehydratase family protein [Halobacillus salinarum]|uniref:NAD-dependent epimerase/dehydratase family protein n=1 Tax=Halobacillus salinarum TaxID=2932257 RepID=A0ABY4ELT4_9BACI|nr:NAD-dependent epimerase/dehydratase family protein [Halobacillus salinarum]UOQ45412.1 NAD-dependent epimerase/dehydratase family protein [Halobacillus salinarum]